MLEEYLSVLALSSRFDGHEFGTRRKNGKVFQYSLCRVVLMVMGSGADMEAFVHLSVLALSSRFDGHVNRRRHIVRPGLSVLALSSRFDGRLN